MHDTIILLDDITFIKHNLEVIKETAGRGNSSIAPLSETALLFLKSKGIPCIAYHEFEKDGVYREVYSTARDWGERWYRPKGEDLTAVDSYSLGSIMEWHLIYFFSHILRLFTSISVLLKSCRPKKIILFTAEDVLQKKDKLAHADISLLPHILKECLRYKDFSCEVEVTNLPYPPPKKKILDYKRPIRYIFFFLNPILSGLSRVSDRLLGRTKKVLFLEGFHHLYSIMKSEQLKGFQKVHLQRLISPALFPKLYSKGISVVVASGSKGQSNSGSALNIDLDKVKDELSDFFIYQGKNISPCVWPRLEFILKEYLPGIACSDLAAYIKAVKETRPDAVVVENDVTYHEKMMVLVANSFDIPTAVVQHGGIMRKAYPKDSGLVTHAAYPLSADFFFAFGKVSRDWLIGRGADPKKVVITGAARFDSYYNTRKRRNGNSKRNKTVLIVLDDFWSREMVATDHIRLKVFYKHIGKYIVLARENPEVQFIIRPHEDGHLWPEIFKEELDSLNNLRISRKEVLEELFLQVDLVIGEFASTVYLEALVYRIPVITIDTGEYFYYCGLSDYGLAKKVTSFQDLDTEIKRLLYNNEEREAFVKRIDENYKLFNYNDDGLATQRISGEINRIISGRMRRPLFIL